MVRTSIVSFLCLSFLLLLCFPVQNEAKKTIIEQSPPFIRVPEGASIKMTCLLKTEAKEEGVYLMRGRAADEKVTYVSKDGNRPFPNFNGRIEASGPAKNLTITLQQLRQSDSDLYYCLGVMHGADLPAAKGTGTLVIVTDQNKITEKLEAPISGQEGDSINIMCATETKGKDVEVYLMRQYVDPKTVIHIPNNGAAAISSAFTNRIEYSGPPNNRTITLQGLQPNDTDVYVCVSAVLTPSPYIGKETSTIVVVTGVSHTQVKNADCMLASWLPYVLVSLGLTLISLVGCILPRVNIKKYFQKEPNAVYEDMASSRTYRVTTTDNPYDNC